MSILIEIVVFLAVLVVLILVHELGHFVVAKIAGIRVDEFGVGIPPRALTFGKIGDTEYTLNWLPFGGFVRLHGEDWVEGGQSDPRAFSSKPKWVQALTLIAGIVMNVLFAYALITVTLIIGTQQIVNYGQEGNAKDLAVAFAQVLPGSPADRAGFKAGDIIKSATSTTATEEINYNELNPAGYITLIGMDASLTPMVFTVERNGKTFPITATPKLNVIPGSASRPGIGVEIVEVGIVKTPVAKAFVNGAIETWSLAKETTAGLYQFFKGIIIFKPDLSLVTGPIGIAPAVGQAAANGLSSLIYYVAFFSLDLALINLIPIPALDGGRLLFVIIEAIIGRPLNPKIAGRVNAVGFTLLIILMFVVSAHDIWNIVK